MDEMKLRQIVRDEIQRNNSGSRFGLNSIPRHTHNNVDSPYTFQPAQVYGGFIVYTGVSGFMPSGWSVIPESTGVYTVTHNLSSDSLYIVLADAYQSTNEKVSPVIELFSDSFTIAWFRNIGGAATNTSFGFTLTVLNNRSLTQPTYTIGS